MPPPMISSTRFVSAGTAAVRTAAHGPGRGEAGSIRSSASRPVSSAAVAQDRAHLVLDRAAAAGRAQAQQLFQSLVELADGERRHETPFL